MSTPVVGQATQTSATPGIPVNVIPPNVSGGYIVNPFNASDQGLTNTEELFIDQVENAGTVANGTTLALQPGQSYTVIPNTTTSVTVASPSGNHKFTAIYWV